MTSNPEQPDRRPSFEKIRFDLRPAKSIERKMLCEAFQRLSAIAPLSEYRYIGFGAIYFSDFSLFHKHLGISNMTSIEREKDAPERFEFNQPYRCIHIEFGESNAVLPELSWDTRSIIWLDYDHKLDRPKLSDVKHVCANAISGSIIAITVNAHPGNRELEKLKGRVGEDKIPLGTVAGDLIDWGTAAICRTILVDEIEETLSQRNCYLSEEKKITFKQLFNFQYRDGARMLTLGGLLYEQQESNLVNRCDFEQLDFYRPGGEPCLIEVPCLTFREIRHLDKLLPHANPGELPDLPWLPQEDIKRYSQVYRYFPTFAEAEL